MTTSSNDQTKKGATSADNMGAGTSSRGAAGTEEERRWEDKVARWSQVANAASNPAAEIGAGPMQKESIIAKSQHQNVLDLGNYNEQNEKGARVNDQDSFTLKRDAHTQKMVHDAERMTNGAVDCGGVVDAAASAWINREDERCWENKVAKWSIAAAAASGGANQDPSREPGTKSEEIYDRHGNTGYSSVLPEWNSATSASTLPSHPGAISVPGIRISEGPLPLQYENNSHSSLSNDDGTLLTTADPPIIEARLVEEQAPASGDSANVVTVPSTTAAVVAKLTCGINFADRKVRGCLGLTVVIILGLAVGLGVSIGGESSALDGDFPTAAPSTEMPTMYPTTTSPSSIPSLSPTILSWMSMDSKISGLANLDYDGGSTTGITFSGKGGLFGSAVSLSNDGLTMAVGFGEDQEFQFRGIVNSLVLARIYVYNRGKWQSAGMIQEESPRSASGISVALSGDGTTVALAYHGELWDMVKIFSIDGVQIGESVEMGDANFISLSDDGSIVAVGASNTSVAVFEFLPEYGDCWNFLGADWPIEANERGRAVSVSGDGSIVAFAVDLVTYSFEECAMLLQDLDYKGFTVKVHQYNATSADWAQLGSDLEVDETESLFSDQSLSLSTDGKIIAIGSSNLYVNCIGSAIRKDLGRVRVLRLLEGIWTPMGRILESRDKKVGDLFGSSVSLSGDGHTIAIGARGDRENGENSGSTTVYKFDGDDWLQVGDELRGARGDAEGTSVSLSKDGTILASGAPNNGDFGGNTGIVRTFNLAGI